MQFEGMRDIYNLYSIPNLNKINIGLFRRPKFCEIRSKYWVFKIIQYLDFDCDLFFVLFCFVKTRSRRWNGRIEANPHHVHLYPSESVRDINSQLFAGSATVVCFPHSCSALILTEVTQTMYYVLSVRASACRTRYSESAYMPQLSCFFTQLY